MKITNYYDVRKDVFLLPCETFPPNEKAEIVLSGRTIKDFFRVREDAIEKEFAENFGQDYVESKEADDEISRAK